MNINNFATKRILILCCTLYYMEISSLKSGAKIARPMKINCTVFTDVARELKMLTDNF